MRCCPPDGAHRGTTTGTMVLFGIPLNVAEELRADLVRRADERMAAL